MNDYMIYYGLTFIAFIITIAAQIGVSSTYKKYKKIGNVKNLSGAEAARMILDKNGLSNVYVVETKGNLTDHYDPSRKVIRLSTDVYNLASIGSVAVAAHECGHAIQDKDGYTFMKIRAALIPLVNFSSYAGYIAIVLGVLFSAVNIIWLGILLECGMLAFQLVTLPVEFDASKRALCEIESLQILNSSEQEDGRRVLTAAAMTYVASVASTILELLRLVLLYTDRDD